MNTFYKGCTQGYLLKALIIQNRVNIQLTEKMEDASITLQCLTLLVVLLNTFVLAMVLKKLTIKATPGAAISAKVTTTTGEIQPIEAGDIGSQHQQVTDNRSETVEDNPKKQLFQFLTRPTVLTNLQHKEIAEDLKSSKQQDYPKIYEEEGTYDDTYENDMLPSTKDNKHAKPRPVFDSKFKPAKPKFPVKPTKGVQRSQSAISSLASTKSEFVSRMLNAKHTGGSLTKLNKICENASESLVPPKMPLSPGIKKATPFAKVPVQLSESYYVIEEPENEYAYAYIDTSFTSSKR